MRRNALHRTIEDGFVAAKLRKWGIQVNPDTRQITSAYGTTNVRDGASRRECEHEIHKHVRAIGGTRKLRHEEEVERSQPGLL